MYLIYPFVYFFIIAARVCYGLLFFGCYMFYTMPLEKYFLFLFKNSYWLNFRRAMFIIYFYSTGMPCYSLASLTVQIFFIIKDNR